jgi:diguanylate cyclase (GGDEF)-like protein/PAS domain S-box-containing protein
MKSKFALPIKRVRGLAMIDRKELTEAALDCYPEGIALLDREGQVVVWNRTAEKITGFPSIEIVARRIPWALEPILAPENVEVDNARSQRGEFIHGQDRSGEELPLLVRTRVLRDDLGERIGNAIIFHHAEQRDKLPHGEADRDSDAEVARTKLEERVEEVFDEFLVEGGTLGVLWITVDQAQDLRKTHGERACETMLDRVERTIANGLRPNEEMGRWGDDEFLVLSHEPSAALLGTHAQVLAGLARTSVFRWWGDRISITVSIGAAQADTRETIVQLLERTQAAMLASLHAGGNHTTLAPGGQACLPS